MNNLAILKEGLEQKPILRPKLDVKIVINAKPKGVSEKKTVLTMEMDNGQQAKDVLELMRHRKISGVSEKFPEQRVEFMETRAPINELKKPIIRKLTGKKVGLIEEPEEITLMEGEQVPRLGKDGLELDLEVGKELGEELELRKKPRAPVKRVPTNIIPLGPEAMITIGDTSIPKRLPPPPEYNLAASSYYMNNREIFVNFINGLFM
jgi:hypothetical protein